MVVEHRLGEQPAEEHTVGSRRAAWRIIAGEEQKEKTEGSEQQAACVREYVAKVKAGLQKIYDGILALIDNDLITSASTGESKVLYYKMKGDYYRYFAEVMENVIAVVKPIPRPQREEMSDEIVEQIVDVPVALVVEEVFLSGEANGDGIHGDGEITRKTLCIRTTLEAFSSWKTLAWQRRYGAVTSPSMKLLLAQSAIFECLWCAQTARAVFAFACAQTFFSSKYARLRRASHRCAGLPRMEEIYKIDLVEAHSRDCLQTHGCLV